MHLYHAYLPFLDQHIQLQILQLFGFDSSSHCDPYSDQTDIIFPEGPLAGKTRSWPAKVLPTLAQAVSQGLLTAISFSLSSAFFPPPTPVTLNSWSRATLFKMKYGSWLIPQRKFSHSLNWIPWSPLEIKIFPNTFFHIKLSLFLIIWIIKQPDIINQVGNEDICLIWLSPNP